MTLVMMNQKKLNSSSLLGTDKNFVKFADETPPKTSSKLFVPNSILNEKYQHQPYMIKKEPDNPLLLEERAKKLQAANTLKLKRELIKLDISDKERQIRGINSQVYKLTQRKKYLTKKVKEARKNV